MKRNLLILFSLFICCSKGVTAVPMGETHTLTLEEAIMLARVQSVDAAVALNELKTAYWEYHHFPCRAIAGSELYGDSSFLSKRLHLVPAE